MELQKFNCITLTACAQVEMDSQIDELYEEGDFDGSSRIPKITWTCISDFPYQYPKKWIFLKDYLETAQGMPVKYPDSGSCLIVPCEWDSCFSMAKSSASVSSATTPIRHE